MNHWNHLENRLRSWKPRRPSPNLKRNIFAAPAAASPASPSAEESIEEIFLPPWRWWAPITAVMIAALTLLSGQFNSAEFDSRTQASLIATTALSHPDLVAYLPAAGHSEANAWQGASFEWTNQGHLISYTNGITP